MMMRRRRKCLHWHGPGTVAVAFRRSGSARLRPDQMDLERKNQAPPIYIYMEHMENVEEYMGGALFRSISFLGGDNMLCQGEESILK